VDNLNEKDTLRRFIFLNRFKFHNFMFDVFNRFELVKTFDSGIAVCLFKW